MGKAPTTKAPTGPPTTGSPTTKAPTTGAPTNEPTIPWKPFPPPEDCDECAQASFKCYEARCEDWDCLWWCRCYDENVDYICEDDNDPCDCEAFGDDLYNVTYEELACSPYMDVQFTGPGADKYNDQRDCCRDPTKTVADCPLE